MRRESLSAELSLSWAKLNNIQLNGIKVSASPERLPINKGSGIFAVHEISAENAILMTVPRELVLSLENIWIYAKSDRHLHEVLEAVGDYARTTRGAILIFLLMQITSNCSDLPIKIGTSTPWTEYVKLMPADIPLPTFWNESERNLLVGTSLKAALDAKLKSLDREFSNLRDATQSIGWCRYWWDEESGILSFEDWKTVDAIYRSRALDLPGTGHAMVPYIDMANHASGNKTVASYETDSHGNAILVLRDGKNVKSGEEITITYGDEKGACEMVFSYGFLERNLNYEENVGNLGAQEIFLDIDIPDDDPLKLAKKAAFDAPPGFRLFDHDGSIEWEGLFVWLVCVNEEDGLGFRVLQRNDGERELEVAWRDTEIHGIQALRECLEQDSLWDLFQLRAVAIIHDRIQNQIDRISSSRSFVYDAFRLERHNKKAWLASELTTREESFLILAIQAIQKRRDSLLRSATVQAYLSQSSMDQLAISDADDTQKLVEEDDFA